MTFPLARARAVAKRAALELAPACDRIEIAGSIRRGAAEVKDVEIVCVPHVRVDLLGWPLDEPTAVDKLVDELISRGSLAPREPRCMGRKHKRLVCVRSGIPLDLFAVLPPASWGAIYAIRTGPADFSRRLVTECQRRGLRCVEGRLVDHTGAEVWTPEERDFFRECGVAWTEPEARV